MTVIAAALATALSAHAQQAAPAKAEPIKAKPAEPAKIQQVEVKGSTEAYDARRDDTASKIVMNHEEIIKYGDTNALDVLKRLPGVTVTGTAGRGGGEVRMRGLGSGYTQILVNGERAPAGFSLDSLAPDAIERIEVMRAATAEFSTQAIAGTINVILKRAVRTAQREIKLSVGYSDRLVAPGYNLQMSDRKGQMSYSLTVNGFHNRFKRDTPSREEAYTASGEPKLLTDSTFFEDGGVDTINIAPRLNWTFANGDTLTSQTFINFARFARRSESVANTLLSTEPGDPDYDPRFRAPLFPFVDWDLAAANRNLRTDLNLVKKLSGGAKLDVKVGGSFSAARNDSYRDSYTAPGGTLLLDQFLKSRATDYGLSSTGKYSTPLFEGHALSVGWDGGFNTRDDLRDETNSFTGKAPAQVVEEFTADVARFAAYGQDEWNVTKNWSVYVGARWEGVRTKVYGNTFSQSRSSTSVWSPLFQTLYKLPNTKDQIRFALTRTYKAPPTQQIIPRRFNSANNSQTEPDQQGNPALKPELALGLDAAYEHYFAEGAMFSISGSVRKIDNYTRTAIILGADGRWIALPSNDGEAFSRSIEFETKFPLKAVMNTKLPIDFRFNMNRNWSTVDNVPGPNNRLDQQTPFSATVGVDYKAGALSAGSSYSFRNGGLVRLSQNQYSFNTVRRDLEAYALWKFDPKNQVRVVVANILAQNAVQQTSYLDNDNSLRKRTNFIPGDTAIRVTLETKF
ncbi:MAG: TonB-dependent receptor [Pseudomonadota bacterium]